MSETSFKEIKHGLSRFKHYKCRCDVCVEANRVYVIQRKEKQDTKKRAGKIPAEPLIALLYSQIDTHSSLGRKVRRWRHEGVDIYTADKLCCEMGYHPYEVFGDLWWKGALDD
jgi:hypothetical protein